MKRILLFVATNFAVLLVISIVFKLLGFEGLLHAGGVQLDYGAVLVYAALIGFSGSLISLFLSKTMAKRAMGVQIIETPTNPYERWLLDTVARLAQEAGVAMPEVGVFDSPQPNAFATGWNRNDALVAVSTGLTRQMAYDEVEAVLGHEMGHVANGDMVTLTLIQGVVNTFVMFLARIIGHTVDRVVFKTERGYGLGYFLVTIVAEMVLGLLASMIVFKFSRWREFRADAAGARLAGRGDMIAALERLRGKQDMPQELPGELTAFGISEQLKQGFGALFSSHPPLETRIAALRAAH